MESRQAIEQKIKEIVQKIVNEYQPEKIILFGSWAWGTPGKDSDVDLFIVKKSEQSQFERIREVKRIIFGTDIATDVLVYTPEQVERRSALGDPLVKKILSSGRLLYAGT
ncbi:MAG: DNA polymerase beta domain-containing protein [Parcubacteria group bacterium Gr01-1014_33]|nr:MAG: DNA polymerase beta domain-containing protein [Parcubacteria group bacterium Gr01-1014_33]